MGVGQNKLFYFLFFIFFFNFLLNFARKKGEHEETGQVYNLFQEHVKQILVFFSAGLESKLEIHVFVLQLIKVDTP